MLQPNEQAEKIEEENKKKLAKLEKKRKLLKRENNENDCIALAQKR